MADSWYDIIKSDDPINQGDILLGCPIIIPEYPKDYLELKNETIKEASAKVYFDNVVVLTQGCLIAGPSGPKVDMVTVAPFSDAKEDSWGTVSAIMKGERPPYYLLNKSDLEIEIDYSIVDFANIYSITYALLDSFRLNTEKRLRLKSPYVEELSQRFGYFYSKVGQPNGSINKDELKALCTKSN
ncbi:hypothetical protein [Paenibacillus sp. ACRRY]|uniref:hypothetical protein n=1 Tax=Paenibacillus sp. ACRRY TaxID=2918208 RepID=UPI001EF40F24|nr:hypothetical protein [Paenibacillus sp. ACRRY]MCG7385125.1 hypothetical protein [Paenibacillus sp. ACRRY]